MGLGHMLARGVARTVAPAVKGAVRRETMKVAREIAPTPAEIARAAQKAVDQMREKNPEVMGKISNMTSKAVQAADSYFPEVVERARGIVAPAQGPRGHEGQGIGATRSSSGASSCGETRP